MNNIVNFAKKNKADSILFATTFIVSFVVLKVIDQIES